jgi:hypothetical protein
MSIAEFEESFGSKEEFARFARSFSLALLPSVLATLLEEGKIAEDRLDEPGYLKSILAANPEIFQGLALCEKIYDDFTDFARIALEEGRTSVAVVLVATAMEHILNWFYRDVLESEGGLTSKEATEVIRSNINTKIGWLLILVTRYELPDDIRSKLAKIFDLRNSLVHYKIEPVAWRDVLEGDSNKSLRSRLQEFEEENFIEMPLQLSRALEALLEKMRPSYAAARRFVSRIFDEGSSDIVKTGTDE